MRAAQLRYVTLNVRTAMKSPLLNDPDVRPSDEVLKIALGRSYKTFKCYMDFIIEDPYSLIFEWKYYNDGYAGTQFAAK